LLKYLNSSVKSLEEKVEFITIQFLTLKNSSFCISVPKLPTKGFGDHTSKSVNDNNSATNPRCKKMFIPGSSPIDWCEDNYTFTPLIAEFFNTVSNALFILMPPILMYLHKPYAASMGSGIQIVWILIVVVGICSAYFHATLALFGQLLDEIAILWAIMAGYALWYPKILMPAILRDKEGRKTFTKTILIFTMVTTFLGFIYPFVNAFFLLSLGVPSTSLLIYNLNQENDLRVRYLGRRSVIFWSLAVMFWISDIIFCEIWLKISFPYLHSIFHVVMCIACCNAIVLFAYFEVKQYFPDERPTIQYWPEKSFELGIPYVQLKSYSLNPKEN